MSQPCRIAPLRGLGILATAGSPGVDALRAAGIEGTGLGIPRAALIAERNDKEATRVKSLCKFQIASELAVPFLIFLKSNGPVLADNVVNMRRHFAFSECFAHRLVRTAFDCRDRRRELRQEPDPEYRTPVSRQTEFDLAIGS